jgi:hypothetical protein
MHHCKNLSYTMIAGAILTLMNPLAAFTFLIDTARNLVGAVTTRDDLHLRPALARKSVAARLASGLILLRAFLRRLIILMALDIEWGLVDKRRPMKRPHGRKCVSSGKPSLSMLDTHKVSPWLNSNGPNFKPATNQLHGTPVPVNMTKLYAQLDFLAMIAANPAAKAKRLAFHLARTHHGIIMAPCGPARVAGRWRTEVRASYDSMAWAIVTKSRVRPPPLAPLRTHWPTIIVL